MWSQLLLCLLVGLAFATDVPAWKKNTEFSYNVHMRTLSSFHDISDKNVGILVRAKLTILSGNGTVLHGKLSQVEYAEIEDSIKDWRQPLPHAIYRPINFLKSPFQILMHQSIIKGLVVNNDLKTWELNIIKSILSQFQLDTKGVNLISDNINILPSEEQNAGIYKTMEDTVSGRMETLYDVHPISEHILELKPWLAPVQFLHYNKYIEVVKNKNHSRNLEPVSFESEHVKDYIKPQGNQISDFLYHSTVSRAILSGNLQNYLIQSSVTYDEIVVSPTFANQQKGSVKNMVNVTLVDFKSQSGEYYVEHPVYIKDLVYLYKKSAEDYYSLSHLSQQEDLQSDEPYMKYGSKHMRYADDEFLSNLQQEYQERIAPPERHYADQLAGSLLLPFEASFHDFSIKNLKDRTDIVTHLCVYLNRMLDKPFEFLRDSSLSVYIKLVKLVRKLDVKDIEVVSQNLLGDSDNDPKPRQWRIFSDAVVQAGTGASLNILKQWIKNGVVFDNEAAKLLYVLAKSTHQPSEEYIRNFFELIKDPEIMEQSQLNETVLLSYTDLLYREYVKTNKSKGIHEEEIIRYLDEHLDRAIIQDDKEKIHTYIVAIGNLGHPKILDIFKKYLNGYKQVSQVQRLLMVLALERLIEYQPLVVQNVLYRIYQNAAENSLVRSASVHLIVRTQPSASVLQRMAQYTNEDENEQVNAAVQSVILTAARVHGREYQYLRSAAKSAVPYLTKKQYGVQDFKEKLLEFVGSELDQGFLKLATTLGGKDSFVPNGFLFRFDGERSNIYNSFFKSQHIVSSIADLVTVYAKQTKEYQDELDQQEPQEQKWSSKQIAKLLHLKIQENEQLEGMAYMHYPLFLVDYIVSFTNQTIEDLPELIQDLEEEYRDGKVFDNMTIFNDHEYSIVLPTASGLLFTFKHNNPIVYQLKGKVTAKSTPPISTGELLQSFEQLDFDISLNALASGKVESRLGFSAPWNFKQYGFGYDRNIHFNFPLKISGQIDKENQQVRLEIEPLEETKKDNFLWVHFSSWPYLFTENLPLLKEKRIHLQLWKPQQYNTTFGLNSTGIAVNVQVQAHELPNLKQILLSLNNGKGSFFEHVNYWTNDRVQYADMSIKVDHRKTTTEKVNLQFTYNYTYNSQNRLEFSQHHIPLSQSHSFPDEVEQRIEKLEEELQSGLSLSHTYTVDSVVEFTGVNKIKYVALAGRSVSSIDANSTFGFYLKRTNAQKHKKYVIAVGGQAYFPNTNALDMDYALEFDPTSEVYAHGVFGDDEQNLSVVDVKFVGKKTKERVEYLKHTPWYKKCKQQEAHGDKQLPTCANMTVQANFLNDLKLFVTYHNLEQSLLENIYNLYSLSRYFLNSYVSENIYAPEYRHNKLYANVHFNPNLTQVDGFLKVNQLETEIKDVKLNSWAKQVFVPHPVFNLYTRVAGNLLGYDIYYPYCVVDKTAVSTFKQVIYPAMLLPQWTVMMLYVPSWAHNDSVDIMQQFDEQVENYAVLVKANSQDSSKKEVMITLQTPETDGKFVEIVLKPPTAQKLPEVIFNNAPIKISKRQAFQEFDGYIQIYVLPNNEIKFELDKDFYIIYDGTRVRLSVVDGKFRGSVRGICGAFEEPATELQNPQGCILNRPHSVILSYTPPKIQNADFPRKCVRKELNYVQVISETDASKQSQYKGRTLACTRHQTQYVQNGKEVCFTLRPVPVCRSGCSPNRLVNKKLPVHCLKDSTVTGLLMKQIDNGGSPDFSNKAETAQLSLKLAHSCSQ